jgi:alkylation response protein AidB-like acyl-CoA dehydrogenase
MDLALNPEYEAYRADVKAFLAREWKGAKGLDKAARAQAERDFRAKAVGAGYLYRGIPKQYGGSEQAPDPVKATIIREEFRGARAPMEVAGNGPAMLVPTLLECGTEWQKEKFVAKTLSGEYVWCQGYSEPGAGSDLASLRTKGELIDGHWVINGQKIWTTLAHYSHYMFILVRTEPEAPKHSGISYLLLDMKSPGITIRPLKQATGASEFCEVFFDNVKTPADWIVGERGKGWLVSRSTLKHERDTIGGTARMDATFESLIGLARRATLNGKPAIADPTIRERLAQIHGYIESMRYSTLRRSSMELKDQDAGTFGTMTKLLGTEINASMAKVARDLLGDDLLLEPPVDAGGLGRTGFREGRRGEEQWVAQFMTSLALAIAGGSSNIQRNIIAERGLGLPRG